jgi:hypothetical protein
MLAKESQRMSQQKSQDSNLGVKLGVFLIGVGALLAGIRFMSGSSSLRKPVAKAQRYNGTPADCLQEMVKKYHDAKAYADQGRLILSFTRGGRRSEQTWDAAIQFVRPGRLRLQAYQLLVVSDVASEDKRFYARLEDPETNNIDNQVVSRAAPESLSLNDFAGDRILADQLGSRLQRPPVQLELLLGEKALASLFTDSFKLEFLEPAEIHGVVCERIAAESASGKYVFWVNAETLLLHKLEYPTSALLPELVQDPFVTDGQLIAEFANATFEPKVSELDFTYTPPSAAHLVRTFVPPPTTSSVDILGKPVGEFEFVSPAGSKITRESFTGKIGVLFWYAHHPLCEKTSQAFAELASKYRDNSDIHFLAICTESADVGDKQILEQLKTWNVSFETARDLKEHRSRTFSVRDLPSIVLMDAAGKYQSLFVGSEGVTALPNALQRLQRGDDLASEAKAQVRKIREEYEKLLAAGGLANSANDSANIAPFSKPEAAELEECWKLDSLVNVRNLHITSGESPRLLVLLNSHEVWEISPTGEVKQKYNLALPKAAEISALRSVKVGEKEYFAAFKPFGPGVFLFDQQFKLLAAYPAEGEEQALVSDVQFAPFKENVDPLLLVGYAETVGLHAINLAGKREWKNRSYVPVGGMTLSLTDSVSGRNALLTGRGTVGVLNAFGNEFPELKVPGWSIVQLQLGKPTEAKGAAYAAIARTANDEPFLLGLDADFAEQWNYPLPNLGFAEPIDFLTHGQLRSQGSPDWVVAWADGSVHIVSADGSFSDNFNSGSSLQGIALLPSGDHSQLVLATKTGVIAWKVREKKGFDPTLPELK